MLPATDAHPGSRCPHVTSGGRPISAGCSRWGIQCLESAPLPTHTHTIPEHIGVNAREPRQQGSRLASPPGRARDCKRPWPLAFRACRLPRVHLLCTGNKGAFFRGEWRQLLQASIQRLPGPMGFCSPLRRKVVFAKGCGAWRVPTPPPAGSERT